MSESLSKRIDAFLAGVYNPANLAGARDQLRDAVFLLHEVQSERRPALVEAKPAALPEDQL